MSAEETIAVADPSRLLMSDALKGQVPELEDKIEQVASGMVHVVAERYVGTKASPFDGVLTTVLFGQEPEIEFRVTLTEAFATVDSDSVTFKSFELIYAQGTVTMPGPFTVKAARIQDIEPMGQTCVLAMCLVRQKL